MKVKEVRRMIAKASNKTTGPQCVKLKQKFDLFIIKYFFDNTIL